MVILLDLFIIVFLRDFSLKETILIFDLWNSNKNKVNTPILVKYILFINLNQDIVVNAYNWNEHELCLRMGFCTLYFLHDSYISHLKYHHYGDLNFSPCTFHGVFFVFILIKTNRKVPKAFLRPL